MSPNRRQSKRLQEKSAAFSRLQPPTDPSRSSKTSLTPGKGKKVLVQNSTDPTPGPPWFDLPKEIRLHILSFTDLVVQYHGHHAVPDLRIYNCKILSNTRSYATGALFDNSYFELMTDENDRPICRFEDLTDCPCIGNPDALLAVDHPLFHAEAMEVMLSKNRLVFEPQKPKQILKYLESLGEDVQWIRRLDVQFTLVDHKRMRLRTHEWNKTSGAQMQNWNTVAAFIRDNLRLDRLELAIDQCLDQEIMYAHRTLWELWNNGPNPAKVFSKMVKPFTDWGPKKGLKSFQIFLTACVHEEERAEKVVMGKNHEVSAGKSKPGSGRCSWHPHELSDTDRSMDGESFLRERMMDDIFEAEMEDEDEFWDDEDEFVMEDYDDFDDIPLAARLTMESPEGLFTAMAQAFGHHGPPNAADLADEDMDNLPPLVD